MMEVAEEDSCIFFVRDQVLTQIYQRLLENGIGFDRIQELYNSLKSGRALLNISSSNELGVRDSTESLLHKFSDVPDLLKSRTNLPRLSKFLGSFYLDWEWLRSSVLRCNDSYISLRFKILRELFDYIVEKYSSFALKLTGGGYDKDDLKQEALIGLFKAACYYCPSLGSFLSYASWWIRQKITEGRSHDALVFIPPSVERKFREFDKSNDNHSLDYRLVTLFKRGIVDLDESLFKDSSETTLHEQIADRTILNPIEQLDVKETCAEVDSLISTVLDKHEELILRCRYGLDFNLYASTPSPKLDLFKDAKNRFRELVSNLGECK